DRGTYEQGGRVPWPEALERGHAVFVLHGEKLRGGFALQRTRPGAKAQWLLIKRKDDEARPGSDIVAERPGSVISVRTLGEPGRLHPRRGVVIDDTELHPDGLRPDGDRLVDVRARLVGAPEDVDDLDGLVDRVQTRQRSGGMRVDAPHALAQPVLEEVGDAV